MTGEEVQKVVEQFAALGREAGGEAGRIFEGKVWPLLVREKLIAGWFDAGSLLLIVPGLILGWRWLFGRWREMRQRGFDFDADGWILLAILGLVAASMLGLAIASETLLYLACPECAALDDLAKKVLRK